MPAAVFLDRDNTLIHNDGDLGDPGQVVLVKGAASAIASLRGLGFKIVVVSNQGGVARGKFEESDVEAVHNRISELVKATSGSTIDRFYYCPYHPEGTVKKYKREHPWRKPNTGMLLQAAEDLGLDLGRSWLIGDQLRDVQAAIAAGVRAILLRSGGQGISQEQMVTGSTHDGQMTSPYWVSSSIVEAVKIVAQQGRTETVPAAEKVTTLVNRPPRRVEPVPAAATVREHETGSVVVEPVSPREPAASPWRARPFRPWSIQPVEVTPVATATVSVQEETTGVQTQTEIETPDVSAATGTTSQAVEPGLIDTAQVDLADDEPSVVPVSQLLRQILQELRYLRVAEAEFSFHQVVAIVLQMVAAVCLLGALWMGAADLGLFIRWVSVGLVMQLATIAMLLFRR